MNTLVLNAEPRLATSVTVPKLYPAFWLLSLLPVSSLIALDLWAGVIRPAIWVARLAPSSLVLALVAWATFTGSPRALRLRKELRLLAPYALAVLVCANMVFLADAPLSRTLAVNLVMPAAGLALLGSLLLSSVAWREEERFGTFQLLATSPLSRVITLEKSVSSAFMVVVAGFILQAAPFGGELSPLTRMVPTTLVLGLIFGPLQVFKIRSNALVLVLTVLTLALFRVGIAIDMQWPPLMPELPIIAVALAVLGVAHRAARRHGLLAPALGTELLNRPTRSMPRAGDQRLAMMLLAYCTLVPLAMLALYAGAPEDFRDGSFATVTVVGFCAWLGPTVLFSENHSVIEYELTLLPRTTLFRRKVINAFVIAVGPAFVVPAGLALWLGEFSTRGAVSFGLAGLGVWSAAIAISTAIKNSALAMVMTLLGGLVLPGLQYFALQLGGCAVTGRMGSVDGGWVVTSAMLVLLPAMWVFAWRRFVALRPRPVRDAVMLTCACVAHALILGAAATMLGLNSGK